MSRGIRPSRLAAMIFGSVLAGGSVIVCVIRMIAHKDALAGGLVIAAGLFMLYWGIYDPED